MVVSYLMKVGFIWVSSSWCVLLILLVVCRVMVFVVSGMVWVLIVLMCFRLVCLFVLIFMVEKVVLSGCVDCW